MSDNTAVATADEKPKTQIAAGGQLAGIAPQSIDEAFRLSQALSRASDMVPQNFKGKPDEIMAAVLRGAEIGLMPMQALSNIAVINGRASLWGDALPALVQKAGHHIDVEVTGEGEDMVATATLTRGDTLKVVTRTFSVTDARAARLWGKQGPWSQYPKRMLSHRARAWAVRDGAADALMGLQVAEEMQDAPMRDVTPLRTGSDLTKRLQAADQPKDDPEKPQEPEDVSQEVPDDEPVTQIDADAMEISADHPAYQEGHSAFSEGVKLEDCPYPDPDDIRANWIAGWNDAKQEAG